MHEHENLSIYCGIFNWTGNKECEMSPSTVLLVNSDPQKKNFYTQNQSHRLSVTFVATILVELQTEAMGRFQKISQTYYCPCPGGIAWFIAWMEGMYSQQYLRGSTYNYNYNSSLSQRLNWSSFQREWRECECNVSTYHHGSPALSLTRDGWE